MASLYLHIRQKLPIVQTEFDVIKSLGVLSKLPLTQPKRILMWVSSSDFIRVPISRDRKWGRWCWTWCEFQIPCWLDEFRVHVTEDEDDARCEFRVHLTENERCSLPWCKFWVPLWLEFRVHVIEDEEVETKLDA